MARGVIPSGDGVGCGIGECSTDEDKYKWRGVNSEAEWNATPEDRRRIKYAKPKGDWDGQTKQIRTNPADLANTCLKMAKKRAQIDLTLTATAASDVFEQDIEDLPEEYRDGMKTDQKVSGKPEVAKPQPKEDKPKDAPPVEGSHITVKIETVTLKSGKKKDGKTWEKYGVKGDNGIWYGTFSKTLGEAAKILEGQPAFITYEQSGEFFTLVDIKPVAPSVAVEGEALPPEESTGIEPF